MLERTCAAALPPRPRSRHFHAGEPLPQIEGAHPFDPVALAEAMHVCAPSASYLLQKFDRNIDIDCERLHMRDIMYQSKYALRQKG